MISRDVQLDRMDAGYFQLPLQQLGNRACTALLLSLLVLAGACNRAVPEKSGASKAGADESESAEPNTPPGVLADKQSPKGQAVLPPDASGASAPISNDRPDSNRQTNDGPPPPGVQIETVNSFSPNEDETTARMDPRLADSIFMKLQLPDAALSPDQLLDFLVQCDRAVQELSIARQANQLNEKLFIEQAKRLSGIKLAASERLYNDSKSTLAQKKTSIAAQVESLSQLTGLGDVQAAQKLLKVAGDLAKSPDVQLAHQGRLVLMGFRLNQLVEGQIKDPQVIVEDVNSILNNSDYRGLVELLAMQQALGVLTQLGYAEQAKLVQDRVVKEFRNSPDKEVAMRSWMIEVANSPELKAVNEMIQKTLTGEEKDTTQVASLATNFINAFPSLNSVAYFLKVIVDLEYSGQVEASRRLSDVVAKTKTQVTTGPLMVDIDHVLDGHTRRLGALGQPLVLDQLTGMDGSPFDWNSYRKKVVLVFFWASWEKSSWELIDQVKALRQAIADPAFEVVGICTDDGRTITNAEQLVSRQDYKWRNLRSSSAQAVGLESAAAKQLGVTAYSHFALLVDKKGTVRAVHPRFDSLEKMVEELLKE